MRTSWYDGGKKQTRRWHLCLNHSSDGRFRCFKVEAVWQSHEHLMNIWFFCHTVSIFSLASHLIFVVLLTLFPSCLSRLLSFHRCLISHSQLLFPTSSHLNLVRQLFSPTRWHDRGACKQGFWQMQMSDRHRAVQDCFLYLLPLNEQVCDVVSMDIIVQRLSDIIACSCKSF